jgi:hypothetical protein
VLAACAFWGASEDVCRHASSGSTCHVSTDGVAGAQEALRAELAWTIERASRVSLDAPYDSGLPACRARGRRAVRVELPRALVGKTIAFAAQDRMPRADLRVASSARTIAAADADALADPAFAARLGVRCVPTLVTVRSESELELVEGP